MLALRRSTRLVGVLIAALSASMFAACKKPEPQASPEAAIQAFYTSRIASGSRGTPSVDELEELAPYISEELHGLLEEALLNHNKISSRTVQKRRTFSEGDLFSSLFDGPTTFAAGSIEDLSGDEHVVSVKLTSGKQLPALTWIDKVKVIHENGRYVVADIEYTNHWAFGSNTKLVSSLRSAITKRSRKNA
jgi:hypothetical protein